MAPSRFRAIVASYTLLTALSSIAGAQTQSGTLLSQGATAISGAVAPLIGIQVAGGAAGKSNGTTTKIFIDIGTEGNGASPAPDPALGAGVTFRVTKSGTSTPVTFTPAGGSDNSTFTNKVVVLVHGLENTASPRGVFALAIAHLTGVGAGATESYTLEITGLPAGMRVVVVIDQGTFTSLAPTGACGGGGGGGGGGVCAPCSYNKVCIDGMVDLRIPLYVWPPGPRPGPDPYCPICDKIFTKDYDVSQFDRVAVAVLPTAENGLLPGCGRDVKFNVEGGEAIGSVFESGGGSCVQLVQSRKGTVPTVTLMKADKSMGSFKAEPQRPGGGGLGTRLGFGFGGLLLGVLAALGFTRGGKGGTNESRPV